MDMNSGQRVCFSYKYLLCTVRVLVWLLFFVRLDINLLGYLLTLTHRYYFFIYESFHLINLKVQFHNKLVSKSQTIYT